MGNFENSILLDTGSVVFNLDAHNAVSRSRHDLDAPGSGVSNRVSHRIFHNRLENQIGNAHVEHFRIDVNVSGQSILKANAFNLEIPVQKFNLLLQGNLL